MENQEVLKAIATLADKVSRYHERLLAVEREKEKIEKTLSEHLKGCNCHPVIEGKPYKSSTDNHITTEDGKKISINLTGLDSEMECEACSA
jgi:hypothetical protein